MALRSGMATLINRLRRMVNDANREAWDNDQEVQDTLDQFRVHVYRERMELERKLLAATDYEYRIYHSRFSDFEEGGTAYFNVEDSGGSQRGTADYTADYINGIVTMGADQVGTALFLTGWSYDLHGAAAALWEERAGQLTGRYDVTVGDQRLSRSQWFKHCADMADMHKQQARAVTVRSWTDGVFEQR